MPELNGWNGNSYPVRDLNSKDWKFLRTNNWSGCVLNQNRLGFVSGQWMYFEMNYRFQFNLELIQIRNLLFRLAFCRLFKITAPQAWQWRTSLRFNYVCIALNAAFWFTAFTAFCFYQRQRKNQTCCKCEKKYLWDNIWILFIIHILN